MHNLKSRKHLSDEINQIQIKIIKIKLKEILYNSLAQACIKVHKTPHPTVKLFLIACICLASSLTSLLVIQSFLDYYKYEVSTTTRVIFEIPSFFPMVTICQSSLFMTPDAFKFLKVINMEFMNDIKLDIFNSSQMATLSVEEKYEKFWRLYLLATAKMNDRRFSNETRKLSYPLEDILLSCKYNNQKCNASDFTWKFDRLFGNCFVFNSAQYSSDAKKSYIGGSLYGLKLAFYANYDKSLNTFNSIFPRGAQIRIENNSFQSYETNFDNIFVAPGYSTSISVERSFKFIKAKPYSNCDIEENYTPNYWDKDFFKEILKSNLSYTQSLCFFECYQRELIKKCNCSDPWFTSIIDISPCSSNNETDCLVQIYNSVFLSSLSDFIKTECVPHCPLECTRKEFKYTISNQIIDNWYYNEKIESNKNFISEIKSRNSSLKESVIAVNVYYNSLTYNLSTESQLKDILSLLAYIGGISGLFLGVSFFSIFELIEVLMDIYFIKKINYIDGKTGEFSIEKY